MNGTNDLIIALLPKEKHQFQYQTEVAFKCAIDTLAAMIPAFVEGIAMEAREQEARRLQQYENALRFNASSVTL